jgi:hypothetical protein
MAKEPFLPNHKWLADDVLLAPATDVFTPLTLFVCTYEATLANLKCNFIDLTARMCQDPHGQLLAVNSNFGHAAQPGREELLKKPKPPPPPSAAPRRSRPRKGQGDSTCFNSAIEPVLAPPPTLALPPSKAGKVYFLKCFPSTGEAQVPGVIMPDLSDGHLVLESFVAYLNELGVGTPGPDGAPMPVTIARERPNMINYKFRLVRHSPRILLDLVALADYLRLLEESKLTGANLAARLAEPPGKRGHPLAKFVAEEWREDPCGPSGPHEGLALPPYPIRETKPPVDDVKISFRFQGENRNPRVNVFQEGKVNILGADSVESAHQIYAFFVDMFAKNWARLVTLQPRRDHEQRQYLRMCRTAATPPRVVVPAGPPLTNEEFDELFASMGLGDDPVNVDDDANPSDLPGSSVRPSADPSGPSAVVSRPSESHDDDEVAAQ